MVEIKLQSNFTKAFLSIYLLFAQIILIEYIVGAIIEEVLGEVEALRFIPIW
jgi:hypothetical protein